MRILAGELRGRVLKTPPGDGTRPMLGRVREAMFGTLGELVLDAQVLDLFAGSGSLGIEALSRGAARARLVEKERAALTALSQNVEALQLGERVEVLRADALSPFAWGAGRDAWIDLAFFDPPYPFLRDARRKPLLATLERILREALTPTGVVVFHAPRRALFEHDFPAGSVLRERTYGTSSLWYLERPASPASPASSTPSVEPAPPAEPEA